LRRGVTRPSTQAIVVRRLVPRKHHLITNEAATSRGGILEAEQRRLADFNRLRRCIRCETVGEEAPALRLTPRQRVADVAASVMGSLTFIIA
jgi:hypothetical protein